MAGIIGASAALMGSFLSQLLVFHIQQKQKRIDRLEVAYQFSLLFLERLKVEGSDAINNKDYYELVTYIAIMPADLRKRVIELYGMATDIKNPRSNVLEEISSFQEVLATKLLKVK
ncbi:MAG: hypothetical protein N0C88_20945 [Candidatus Thiodiazotropha lotti]|uniref:Uncharacterized protein n=1 Tax=Candidatus Thiodiazotropha lotti TaxID=2792787 RepID=A0A9E4N1Q3_9GAMM|nr:hypothetical protein [Candidatus Thiodiazotropha lotti]MCW4205774.1 hypothetical protein [Candidatus Thiodiazotropha lotti]